MDPRITPVLDHGASSAFGHGKHIIREGHEMEGGGEVGHDAPNPSLQATLGQYLINLTWLAERRDDDVVEFEVGVQGKAAADSRVVWPR